MYMQSPYASSQKLFCRLLALCFSLIILLFLDACSNERPFSSRRYLPGNFHESHSERQEVHLPEKNSSKTKVAAIVPASEISFSVSDTSGKSHESTSPANTFTGIKQDTTQTPPDTTEPPHRKKRRWKYLDEKQKVDRTLGYGINTLSSGALFLLLGLLLAKGANQFTNEIAYLLILILLIIPLFFASGVTVLVSAILEILSASRLKSEHAGKNDYESHSKVKLAGIFVVIGLILTAISAIFFLPHFLDW